jgi:VCBS repeat-containing protein
LFIPAVDGILINDTDADGDTLIASLIPGPMNGTLTLQADGSFVYTPNEGFTGVDSFEYRAYDGQALSDTVSVTLHIVDQPWTYLPIIIRPD